MAIKVKLNTQTFYGKPLQVDDVVEVPGEVGKRWISRGIASPASEEQSAGDEVVGYAAMKAKELYELCTERGIEAEAKKSKEYYIELLEADDQAKAAATDDQQIDQ